MNPFLKILLILTAALALVLISVETTLLVVKHKESTDQIKMTTAVESPMRQSVQAQIVAPASSTPAANVAQIISVKPHYITVATTRHTCRNVERIVYIQQPSHNAAGIVVGGVAGGALDNALIHGNSQTTATIAGATVGALAGSAVEKNLNKPQPHVVYEKVCSTYPSTKKVQKGYVVTYSHNGEQGTIILNYKPKTAELSWPIQKK